MLQKCGTTDDLRALEEIMQLASIEPDDLEDAAVRLEEIFMIAEARLKGDDDA